MKHVQLRVTFVFVVAYIKGNHHNVLNNFFRLEKWRINSSNCFLSIDNSDLVLPNPVEVEVRTESSGEDVFADWDRSDDARDDANLTAHFVRAVADLAAQTVHLTNSFRGPLSSRSRHRLHTTSLLDHNETDIPIHSNLSRITHFVEVN